MGNETVEFITMILEDMYTSGVLYQMETDCSDIQRVIYEHAYFKYGLIEVISHINPEIDLEYMKRDIK